MGLSPEREPARATSDEGLLPTEIGDAVHAILELGPMAEVEPQVRARYPDATPADVQRVSDLVEAWNRSALGHRLAALDGARFELPFAFEHDGVLLHGRLDVFHSEAERSLVVDYKTNRLGGEPPESVVEAEYRLQRLVYALAALKQGAEEVEVTYVFLEQPDEVVSRVFGRLDLPDLSRQLSEAIEAIRSGDFRPSPSEHACFECPALDRVCAGPRLPLRRVGSGSATTPVPT